MLNAAQIYRIFGIAWRAVDSSTSISKFERRNLTLPNEVKQLLPMWASKRFYEEPGLREQLKSETA